MRIQVDSNQLPLRNRLHWTPLNKRKIINQAFNEMIEAKVIERSLSPWSFPLVVVKKKDGSDMICVDFRTLNKIVRSVSYPFPFIDDILSLLGTTRYFTALDIEIWLLTSTTWRRQQRKDGICVPQRTLPFQCHALWSQKWPAVFQ